MRTEEVIQGRLTSPADVELIRDLLVRHEGWNRSQLSRELCLRWDWRNGKGQLKATCLSADRWLLVPCCSSFKAEG